MACIRPVCSRALERLVRMPACLRMQWHRPTSPCRWLGICGNPSATASPLQSREYQAAQPFCVLLGGLIPHLVVLKSSPQVLSGCHDGCSQSALGFAHGLIIDVCMSHSSSQNQSMTWMLRLGIAGTATRAARSEREICPPLKRPKFNNGSRGGPTRRAQPCQVADQQTHP